MSTFQEKTTATQDIITGCITGAADVLSTHPLWTIKTLTQDGLGAKQIVALIKGNPLILYNGVTANALSMVPITATRVFLGSYFEKLQDHPTPLSQLALSCVAGSISSCIGTPIEFARAIKLKSTVLSTNYPSILHPEYNNTLQVMKSVWKTNGGFGLFKGYGAIAIRDGTYTAAFLTGTKLFKDVLDPYFDNEVAKTLCAYSSVSILTSLMNHPFDSIKTEQHMRFTQSWQLGSSNNSGFTDACKAIYAKDGISGFWCGYSARGARFLVGLIVKALVIEKMDSYWQDLNTSNEIQESKQNEDALELIGEDS